MMMAIATMMQFGTKSTWRVIPKARDGTTKARQKAKLTKGKTWTNGGNTTWKGSNNRSVWPAVVGSFQVGQYNGQHNAQHGHHNNHWRSTEWNDWEKWVINDFFQLLHSVDQDWTVNGLNPCRNSLELLCCSCLKNHEIVSLVFLGTRVLWWHGLMLWSWNTQLPSFSPGNWDSLQYRNLGIWSSTSPGSLADGAWEVRLPAPLMLRLPRRASCQMSGSPGWPNSQLKGPWVSWAFWANCRAHGSTNLVRRKKVHDSWERFPIWLQMVNQPTVFLSVSEERNYPMAFGCIAGKDRTGTDGSRFGCFGP